jgi:hypothetical protein
MQICFELVVSTPAQRNLFGDVFVGVLPQQSDGFSWLATVRSWRLQARAEVQRRCRFQI